MFILAVWKGTKTSQPKTLRFSASHMSSIFVGTWYKVLCDASKSNWKCRNIPSKVDQKVLAISRTYLKRLKKAWRCNLWLPSDKKRRVRGDGSHPNSWRPLSRATSKGHERSDDSRKPLWKPMQECNILMSGQKMLSRDSQDVIM
jgi:hypothetical protein